MAGDPEATFRERAPLLEPFDFSTLILFDVLHPVVSRRVRAIDVFGPFVDADEEVDPDTDGIRVYVTVEEGTLDSCGVDADLAATRFEPTPWGMIRRLVCQGAMDLYGDYDPFREPLPGEGGPVGESIKRAERTVVHARRWYAEEGGCRALELILSDETTADAFLSRHTSLRIYPPDLE